MFAIRYLTLGLCGALAGCDGAPKSEQVAAQAAAALGTPEMRVVASRSKSPYAQGDIVWLSVADNDFAAVRLDVNGNGTCSHRGGCTGALADARDTALAQAQEANLIVRTFAACDLPVFALDQLALNGAGGEAANMFAFGFIWIDAPQDPATEASVGDCLRTLADTRTDESGWSAYPAEYYVNILDFLDGPDPSTPYLLTWPDYLRKRWQTIGEQPYTEVHGRLTAGNATVQPARIVMPVAAQ